MRDYTFRLKPGQDLFDSIVLLLKEKNIRAGCVLSGVGSLTHVTLRLANRDFFSEYDGHYEIVSITGTVSIHGSHLHISASGGDGETIGGHLVSGCVIYTTAESINVNFQRTRGMTNWWFITCRTTNAVPYKFIFLTRSKILPGS